MPISSAEYLVVGAGPAGLTAARLLALKGRKVVVVDPGTPPPRRLELLAPPALGILAAIGIESLLHDPTISRRCLGIRRVRATGHCEYEDFLHHSHRMGYVVNRARFDTTLRCQAAAASVQFYLGRVIGIDIHFHRVRVQPSKGPTTSFPFTGAIIDATGRAAMVARRKGAYLTFRDRMVADLIEETFNRSPNDTASWLDFESDGANWSYRIRGPQGLTQTWRVGRSAKVAGRNLLRVDASACRLSEAAGQDWVAVGDAAISFDPIASQGLFNALSSALVATGMIMSAEGLNVSSARFYSDIVAETFAYSEFGRLRVYESTRLLGTAAKTQGQRLFSDALLGVLL